MTNGLVDPVKKLWRGIFDPTGRSLSKSIFAPVNKNKEHYRQGFVHTTPSPGVARDYAEGMSANLNKDPRIAALKGKPKMLVGVVQSTPTEGTIDWNRKAVGSKKLDSPVVGPDFYAEKGDPGAMISERRGVSKRMRKDVREYGDGRYYSRDAHKHEALTKVAPGGGRKPTYLAGDDFRLYEPVNPADLAEVRRQVIRDRWNWYKGVKSNSKVRDMMNRGYFGLVDVNRNTPVTGVELVEDRGSRPLLKILRKIIEEGAGK
jgi:hypothetical protein